jgi:hypothetical protein
MGVFYERVRGTLQCHLCGTTAYIASYGSSTPYVFFTVVNQFTTQRPNARSQTCRYDLLGPLVQAIVSTKTWVFVYVICEDQKYDSRGFVLYPHLNQWQAARGVRQFSNTRSPIKRNGGFFLAISWTSHALLNVVGTTEDAIGFSPPYVGHFTPVGARAGAKIRRAKLQHSPYTFSVKQYLTTVCASVFQLHFYRM